MLLLRMVEPGQGTPDTRRPLTRAELAEWADPEAPAVVERLARARLLTADEDGVQLAHEALITCWPRLHGWIEQDRERLRHHRRLTEAARAWLEHDRDPGALYRGSRLARAEELFPDDGTTPADRAGAGVPRRRAGGTEGGAAGRCPDPRAGPGCWHRRLSAVLAVALVAAWPRGAAPRQRAAAHRRPPPAVSPPSPTPCAPPTRAPPCCWASPPGGSPRCPRPAGPCSAPSPSRSRTPSPTPRPATRPRVSSLTPAAPCSASRAAPGGPGTWPRTAASARAGCRSAVTVVGSAPDATVLALSGDDGTRLWDTAAGRLDRRRTALPAFFDLAVGDHADRMYRQRGRTAARPLRPRTASRCSSGGGPVDAAAMAERGRPARSPLCPTGGPGRYGTHGRAHGRPGCPAHVGRGDQETSAPLDEADRCVMGVPATADGSPSVPERDPRLGHPVGGAGGRPRRRRTSVRRLQQGREVPGDRRQRRRSGCGGCRPPTPPSSGTP